MNKFGLLGFIVAALIIVLAARRFLEQRKQNEINDSSVVTTYEVTVAEKKDYPYPNMRSRERDVVFPETFRYEVHFRPLSGKTIVVYIKEAQYREITLHSRGTLFMQGTRFIRYEPLR